MRPESDLVPEGMPSTVTLVVTDEHHQAQPTAAVRPNHVRAKALPPDQRRAAIIDAALPLLVLHGSGLTSKQIAESAGIAEGTIFRVFADKESLIEACIERAFDPSALVDELSTIDGALESRMVKAIGVLQDRVQRLFQLMSVLNVGPNAVRQRALNASAEVDALSDLIEREPDGSKLDPTIAGRIVRGLAFVGTHPMFTQGEPISPESLAHIALYGLRGAPADPTQGSGAPC